MELVKLRQSVPKSPPEPLVLRSSFSFQVFLETKFAHSLNRDLFSLWKQILQHVQQDCCLAPVPQCCGLNLNSTTLEPCLLLNADCCLLRIVEILGGCNSVRQVILQVEAVFPGWEIDRRVLSADVDAEVGLKPAAGCRCARGPNCPSSWRSAQGVCLIPVSVSGEGVQDGGGVQQKEDRVGTPWRDMMCGECFLGCTQETRRSYLEPKLEPTRVCVGSINVRTTQRRLTHNTTQTDKTEKNVRAVRCSVPTRDTKSLQ